MRLDPSCRAAGPLTVTPDGLLLCGWRRLEAVKRLGWKTVPVYVRRVTAGLRDLIAEHDENTIREPLPLETAEELYREYKAAETGQAALRQHATRFHATKNSGNTGWKDGNTTGSDMKGGGKRDNTGPAESAGPQQDESVPGRRGDARAKAAQMVTGTKSYTRLEHAGRIKDTRDDLTMPDHIRAMAQTAWHDITTNGASPEKHWKQIRAAITEHHATNDQPQTGDDQVDTADLATVARAALARPRTPRPSTPPYYLGQTATPREARRFVEVLTDVIEWIDQADVGSLAADMNSSDLTRLHRTTERLDLLCTKVHAARHKRHPALRRQKQTGAQGHAVNEEQPPLW